MKINYRLLLATTSILITFFFGVIKGGPPVAFFLNAHALILVFAGTLCVLIFSNSLERIKSLVKLSVHILQNDFHDDRIYLVYRLYYVSAIRFHKSQLSHFQSESDHPFIGDSLKLLDESMVTNKDYQNLLSKRLEQIADNYTEDAQALTALAKYPPAMGLVGATSGMISMMMTIGTGDKSAIGKSMATALVATLWGIAVANFVLLPLADLATRMNTENLTSRKMIAEAFELIQQQKHPDLVLEFLLCYIPIDQRDAVTEGCLNWYNTHMKKGSFSEKNKSYAA